MLKYILRRILLMIPTLIGTTFLLFAIVRFSPGLSSSNQFKGGMMKGGAGQRAQVLAEQEQMGLRDKNGHKISIPVQYVNWIDQICQGNLGVSKEYSIPVLQLIKERLPVTLTMNVIELLLVYLIAIPAGMLSAVKRGKMFDFSYSFISLALYSLPVIWVGAMALGFLANPQYLPWFPAAGTHSTNTSNMTFFQYCGDYLYHIVLPIICMTYGGFAYLSKQVRAGMLDALQQDYVRTARAKGVGGVAVTIRHVFRNTLLPLITMSAGLLPGLLGGSVIIEKIFSIKGMGALMYRATFSYDLPVLQASALIGGVLTLFSYLVVDISYAIADPRVSYE